MIGVRKVGKVENRSLYRILRVSNAVFISKITFL